MYKIFVEFFFKIPIPPTQEAVGSSVVPRCVWVCLEDDLVDTCQPGDEVTVWWVKNLLGLLYKLFNNIINKL